MTTNSSKGVDEIEKNISSSKLCLKLECHFIHGETNEKEIDIFDREKVFIDLILEKIINRFQTLK